MTATVWPARRVGSRILCGRQVDGQYVCQGEIATTMATPGVEPRSWGNLFGFSKALTVILPPGLTADDGNHWRPTARAHDQRERGRQPVGRDRMRLHLNKALATLPFTRNCPHCNCTAQVDSTVLNSG